MTPRDTMGIVSGTFTLYIGQTALESWTICLSRFSSRLSEPYEWTITPVPQHGEGAVIIQTADLAEGLLLPADDPGTQVAVRPLIAGRSEPPSPTLQTRSGSSRPWPKAMRWTWLPMPCLHPAITIGRRRSIHWAKRDRRPIHAAQTHRPAHHKQSPHLSSPSSSPRTPRIRSRMIRSRHTQFDAPMAIASGGSP
jgi:hypothetical protein